MLPMWTTRTLGKTMPTSSGHGYLHQPHVQAKISQVGDETILTRNKGWAFDLNAPHQRTVGGADNPTGRCSLVGLKAEYRCYQRPRRTRRRGHQWESQGPTAWTTQCFA